MYLSGIAVTLFGVYMSDGAQVLEKGFFYGYTHYVWFVICKYLMVLWSGYVVLLFLTSGVTGFVNLQIQFDPLFLTVFFLILFS